ncbi:MAG: TM2 domain-containing protein [Clostridiales bacterium]|nr:TM2 domain-containing protein [Clostridiales bacterium]
METTQCSQCGVILDAADVNCRYCGAPLITNNQNPNTDNSQNYISSEPETQEFTTSQQVNENYNKQNDGQSNSYQGEILPQYQQNQYNGQNYQYGQQPYNQQMYGQQYGQYPVYGAKSKVAAALLAFFLGVFGVHNFYLGYITKAVVQLVLTVIGIFTLCLVVGGFIIFAVEIWAFVEFVMILAGGINTDARGIPLQN